MAFPYPSSSGTDPWKNLTSFTARIPFFLGVTSVEQENRYCEIEFEMHNNGADNLTIAKTVTGDTTSVPDSYTVGTVLYQDAAGTQTVTAAQMPGPYVAYYYQYDAEGELIANNATVTIDAGQIKVLKEGETTNPYIPILKGGEKLVIQNLFPNDGSNPVKSLKSQETNIISSFEN